MKRVRRVEIVSNSSREIIALPKISPDLIYIYIPMTDDEKKIMDLPDTHNLCFRLVVEN